MELITPKQPERKIFEIRKFESNRTESIDLRIYTDGTQEFHGTGNLVLPNGAKLPFSFKLEAATIEDAFELYMSAFEVAAKKNIQELEAAQRRAALLEGAQLKEYRKTR